MAVTSSVSLWEQALSRDAAKKRVQQERAAKKSAEFWVATHPADEDPSFAKPNEDEIVTENMPESKWAALAQTFNEALREYIETYDGVKPIVEVLPPTVTLPSYMDKKGWRTRTFFKGNEFELHSAVVHKRGGLLLRLIPTLMTDDMAEEGFQHAEVNLKHAPTYFGDEFTTTWENIMGMTILEAIGVTTGTRRPKKSDVPPEKPKREVETLTDWGDW